MLRLILVCVKPVEKMCISTFATMYNFTFQGTVFCRGLSEIVLKTVYTISVRSFYPAATFDYSLLISSFPTYKHSLLLKLYIKE